MERLTHTYYINLDRRPDRRTQIESELSKLPLRCVERFPAISHKFGFIGCTESHIRCLELAIDSGYDSVFICEDDMEILDATQLNDSLDQFLKSKTPWDVILVCANVMHPVVPHSSSAIQIKNAATTSGYIVKNHYMPKLLANFKEGCVRLKRKPGMFAWRIDAYWRSLQRTDAWFALQPFNAIQRASFSDIERRHTDYSREMLKVGPLSKKSE